MEKQWTAEEQLSDLKVQSHNWDSIDVTYPQWIKSLCQLGKVTWLEGVIWHLVKWCLQRELVCGVWTCESQSLAKWCQWVWACESQSFRLLAKWCLWVWACGVLTCGIVMTASSLMSTEALRSWEEGEWPKKIFRPFLRDFRIMKIARNTLKVFQIWKMQRNTC